MACVVIDHKSFPVSRPEREAGRCPLVRCVLVSLPSLSTSFSPSLYSFISSTLSQACVRDFYSNYILFIYMPFTMTDFPDFSISLFFVSLMGVCCLLGACYWLLPL